MFSYSFFKSLLPFFFLPLAYTPAEPLPQKVSKALKEWKENNPQEKIFVHLDKDFYVAGQPVWFKAYIKLDGKPTDLSRVVYVTLVNESGNVIARQMHPVSHGSAFGDFILPENLSSGNYSLNAYTLWMMNFDGYIFRKEFVIYNNNVSKVTDKKAKADFFLDFFPESGDLIQDVKSEVAFKAVNEKGLPVTISGDIADSRGQKITSFQSEHDGYGKFEITPVGGESFYASAVVNGIRKKIPLPSVKPEGIVMQVNNENPGRLFVLLQRSEKNKARYNNLLLSAQINGRPVFYGNIDFDKDETAASILKKNIEPGILHITVFDTAGTPLAERLAFISNYEVPELSISYDTIQTQGRKKNKFTIDLSAYDSASISVSVTDADVSTSLSKENSIVSSLLLTSDLKGYIHNPGYYLKDKEPKTLEHLDLLLMTHGWRRFNWLKLLAGKNDPLKFPVESGILVTGVVTIPESKRTIAGGYVDVLTKGEDSTTVLSTVKVNEQGEFGFSDLSFRQKATLFLQGTKQSNKTANVEVKVKEAYIDTLKSFPNVQKIDLDTLTETAAPNNPKKKFLDEVLGSKEKIVELAEVTVTARKTSRIDSLSQKYASGLFEMSSMTLEPTRSHYLNIWQFLREQVPGLRVEGGNIFSPQVFFNRFEVTTLPLQQVEEDNSTSAGMIETGGITYFLNEINVSKEIIDNLAVEDVALIKVYRGPDAVVLGAGEGAISIYTKKDVTVKAALYEKGFLKVTRTGYAIRREFFNPDYEKSPDSKEKDSRVTLYWNPHVNVNSTGKSAIVFYNNDVTKKFKLVVNGIDKNGELIFTEKILQ